MDENDAIEVVGYIANDKFTSIINLFVNGDLLDSFESKPKDGIFGCDRNLETRLESGKLIQVRLKAHFFMRPLYVFFVNGKERYRKKGTWGGM